MTISEIVVIINSALKLVGVGAELIEKMNNELRTDTTPEETAELIERQAKVDSDWAAELEKRRHESEDNSLDI